VANFWFTEAARALFEAELDLASIDARMALVMSNTTADTEEDVLTIGDFTTLDEYDGSGYSTGGQALDGESVAADNANNRAEFDATDEVFVNLGPGTRQCVGVVIYQFIGSFSASRPLFFVDTGGFPFDGNGNDITFQWNAEGVAQGQA
jgi:hypothetical protein